MAKDYWNTREEKTIERTNLILDRLPDFVSRFIFYISDNTAALTRENYTRDIEIFFEYISKEMDINIEDISTDLLGSLSVDFFSDYSRYLSNNIKNGKPHKVSEVTKARRLSSLRSLYKYLYVTDQIKENQMSKMKSPKLDDKEIIRLEDEESINLLSTILTGEGASTPQASKFNDQLCIRDYTIIALLLNTGIRVSECVGLDISDINTELFSLRVIRKGHSEYTTLYYSDEMAQIMDDYLEERLNIKDVKEGSENALFLSNRRQRIAVRSVEELVKKYSDRAGILKHITPHKLRSTYGTSLYLSTGDIRAVSDALGHKSIETTSRRYIESGKEVRKRNRGAVSLTVKDSE